MVHWVSLFWCRKCGWTKEDDDEVVERRVTMKHIKPTPRIISRDLVALYFLSSSSFIDRVDDGGIVLLCRLDLYFKSDQFTCLLSSCVFGNVQNVLRTMSMHQMISIIHICGIQLQTLLQCSWPTLPLLPPLKVVSCRSDAERRNL